MAGRERGIEEHPGRPLAGRLAEDGAIEDDGLTTHLLSISEDEAASGGPVRPGLDAEETIEPKLGVVVGLRSGDRQRDPSQTDDVRESGDGHRPLAEDGLIDRGGHRGWIQTTRVGVVRPGQPEQAGHGVHAGHEWGHSSRVGVSQDVGEVVAGRDKKPSSSWSSVRISPAATATVD